MVPEAGCRYTCLGELGVSPWVPVPGVCVGSASFMVRGPMLGILPSKMLSYSWLWPAAPVYQNPRILAARLAFSPQASRVYLSCRKIKTDRDPGGSKTKHQPGKVCLEAAVTVRSRPAHSADTILGSLIECRSVLHTSRGGSSGKAMPGSSRCSHLLHHTCSG